jgi:hypothetical protein
MPTYENYPVLYPFIWAVLVGVPAVESEMNTIPLMSLEISCIAVVNKMYRFTAL